jgi:hypothetical protein
MEIWKDTLTFPFRLDEYLEGLGRITNIPLSAG